MYSQIHWEYSGGTQSKEYVKANVEITEETFKIFKLKINKSNTEVMTASYKYLKFIFKRQGMRLNKLNRSSTYELSIMTVTKRNTKDI